MGRAAQFPAPISEEIWNEKYRLKEPDGTPFDLSLDDTCLRVARAAAAVERGGKAARERWAGRYAEALASFEFLPAGRILAGAGTQRSVTLANCFVLGTIPDDLGGIFDAVKDAALTMQAGGGIGHDFSTLRPKGALVHSIGADASGPLSFMDVWDAMCRTIMSAGSRRGAMMATMRCDHPDIEAFIAAKADPARLRNFNLSVLVTDAFMAAVETDRPWNLVFEGKVWRTLPARRLWDQLMQATYDYAEPGVVFIDRINARNNLAYCEDIHATNPCGEQPLPPYGACLLGSINLAALVKAPFTASAAIDLARLEERVALAVRFLDAVLDVSRYPLAAQRHEARAKRRIGLGVTGLADALICCGIRYGSAEAAATAGGWMQRIQNAAYRASAALAAEKGAFPLYDKDAFLASPNVVALEPETHTAVARNGVRNGCLTSIAPTGTISLLAGNVSSGIEPVFDLVVRRRVLAADGSRREEILEDAALRTFRSLKGASAPLPEAFVTTADLSPKEHIAMQAAVQQHVDSAISKTVNCPADISFAAFKDVYRDAYAAGLKGCTTFRPNAITGAVLTSGTESPAAGDDAGHAVPRSIEQQPPPSIAASVPSNAVAPPPAGPPPSVAVPNSGDVVYMAPPLERDAVLAGYTYKLKWPTSDHAIYVTINDIEREGSSGSGLGTRRRPFEIFINTRNLEHYAWTVALTRMISAVFRRGGDVTFVAEELKAVFDPQGGQWVGGRYVPSLLAAIGEVIEAHMARIGFSRSTAEDSRGAAIKGGSVEAAGVEASEMPIGAEVTRPPAAPSASEAAPTMAVAPLAPGGRRAKSGHAQPHPAGGTPTAPPGSSANWPAQGRPALRFCPRCSSAEFTHREGCWTCASCGFSRCG